jgi:hypothetical protein
MYVYKPISDVWFVCSYTKIKFLILMYKPRLLCGLASVYTMVKIQVCAHINQVKA